ncbi:MAG: DUF488 family protein [Longimicrobiales bacterium]
MFSKAPDSAKTVYTIGHSTRSEEAFIDLLTSYGIEEVVDVRRFPGSRRNPQFNKGNLKEALANVDIEYTHMPELGGRRGRPDPASPNTGWRVSAFQAYADRMAEPDWVAALDALGERCRRNTVAYMCAEAVPWRCHRRLISDALTVRGFEVRHILSQGRADLHHLPEFARVLSSGRIVYPPPASST